MDLGNLANKAKDLATEHADKIEDGIDKVAELADGKTGGKHSDKIDGAVDKIKGLIPKDNA